MVSGGLERLRAGRAFLGTCDKDTFSQVNSRVSQKPPKEDCRIMSSDSLPCSSEGTFNATQLTTIPMSPCKDPPAPMGGNSQRKNGTVQVGWNVNCNVTTFNSDLQWGTSCLMDYSWICAGTNLRRQIQKEDRADNGLTRMYLRDWILQEALKRGVLWRAEEPPKVTFDRSLSLLRTDA
ncbi:uncharacterized protein LOC144762908 [Lissotriton helveticus]